MNKTVKISESQGREIWQYTDGNQEYTIIQWRDSKEILQMTDEKHIKELETK